MNKPKYTQAMLMKADLITLATTVNDRDAPAGERLKCAEALYARLPELNGGNWLLMGQKMGFNEDETREIKRAMDFQATILKQVQKSTL
jgi:hypothetical protein